MDRVLVWLVCVAVLAATGCLRAKAREPAYARVRTSCSELCESYVDCERRGPRQMSEPTCNRECRTIFTDPDNAEDLSDLSCEQIVDFIEGGRGPRAAKR